MVLLPGCACCGTCGGDVCCELADKFMAATSLEIDIAGTDAQAIGYGTVKYGPTCGYNTGDPYIVFEIFKGSLYTGTYSLSLISQTGIYPVSNTGINAGNLFARIYSYQISSPPYICGASIEAYIELQRTFPPPNYSLAVKLYSVFVVVNARGIGGRRRGSTSLPSFSGCGQVVSQCSQNSETGGSFSYRPENIGNILGGGINGIFVCGDSFSLSSVQSSATLFLSDYPAGYCGGGFLGDEKGCLATVDSEVRTSAPTMSFSNLVIP